MVLLPPEKVSPRAEERIRRRAQAEERPGAVTTVMNSFQLVGQIDSLPQIREVGGGIKTADMVLKVLRPFKDTQGVYQYDRITIELWRGLAETLCRASQLDSWISVKGRISARQYTRNEKTFTSYSFVAESIGFIN